jgi:lysine N6-hydroxylase
MHSHKFISANEVLDAAGVGIGPFNLSLAALADSTDSLTTRFFERSREFQWHPGLLFPESTIQVSHLKDLVTLADPTNPCSFLAFLAASGRLYRFINANFDRIPRVEFNQYLRWAAARLSNVEFGAEVRAITFDRTSFLIDVGGEQVRARNVILGTGLRPSLPECAIPFLGPSVFHASQYLLEERRMEGRRVAVIGGGQTGAEVVSHLLSDPSNTPEEVYWISRRTNYLPLDESPFTNELFTPRYSDYFYHLPPEDRLLNLSEQKLASDGISQCLLEKIYQQLYQDEFHNRSRRTVLCPRSELVSIEADEGSLRLSVRGGLYNQTNDVLVDVVVLATGFEYAPSPALAPILDRTSWSNEGFAVREDYSIEWDGPSNLKIYMQNGARRFRGIADPNLSLMAWRSAKIINSLAGHTVYPLPDAGSVFELQEDKAMAKVAR